MPTILDQLTIELGWDAKKFFETSKDIEQVVRNRKDDFERQSKVWEFALGNLSRLLTRVAAAFLSIEAAIRGIELSRTLSRSGAEFANLADTIGMSVTQLSQWEQALERVGGNAGEIGKAFKHQQELLAQLKTGLSGGLPAQVQGYMQRLGMPDYRSYETASGNFDSDKFTKDLADAMNRYRDPRTGKPLSAAERYEYGKAFGFDSPASQRLLAGDLRGALDATKQTAMTQANIETFKRLNEQWTQLGQIASQVSRDLITYLEDPITRVIKKLQQTTEEMGKFLKALEGARYVGPFSTTPTWDNPLGLGGSSGTGPGITVKPPTSSPAGPSWLPWPFGSSGEKKPGVAGGAGTSSPPEVTSLPPGATSMYKTPGAIMSHRGGSSVPPSRQTFPRHYPTEDETPGNFDERFKGLHPSYDRHGSLDYFGTTLPRSAMSFAATATGGSTQTNNKSNVTIGGMSFYSRASDTAMGHAPATVQKDLSVGSYAYHLNESFE